MKMAARLSSLFAPGNLLVGILNNTAGLPVPLATGKFIPLPIDIACRCRMWMCQDRMRIVMEQAIILRILNRQE